MNLAERKISLPLLFFSNKCDNMESVRCKSCDYNILRINGNPQRVYPYLRCADGELLMTSVSPTHGRSYVVDKTIDGNYIISKGNGLSYSQYNFINTREIGDETLGLLLKKDALRDYHMGIEMSSLGIKTNCMEYVIELGDLVTLPTGNQIHPVLLQYQAECPYRINDAAFVTKKEIDLFVSRWSSDHPFEYKYQIAAERLVKNLRLLHDAKILHNAITTHNITWALELLDFELACSPNMPYETEDEQRHVKDLFSREIICTYQIINYIAGVLKETIDDAFVDSVFYNYGFNLSEFKIDYE